MSSLVSVQEACQWLETTKAGRSPGELRSALTVGFLAYEREF